MDCSVRSPARKALIRNFTTPYLTTWEFLTTVKILTTGTPNRADGIAWDFKDYTSNETMNFQNSATDNVDTEENHMKLAENAENFVPSDLMSDEECLCVTADITCAECGDSAVEDRHNWTCQNVWWLSLLLHPQLGVG